MFLFGKSHKGPFELIKAVNEALPQLIGRCPRKSLRAQEEISKNLVLMKNMLYGNNEHEPQADIVVAQLAQELYNSDLLYSLIKYLAAIDFEAKKDVALIFNNILR